MSNETLSERQADGELILGLQSFTGSQFTQTDEWHTALKCGQPPLHFIFEITPFPNPPTSSQRPGIAPEYDLFVKWKMCHYRIALGRLLFAYKGDQYFLAFVYPEIIPNFFNGTFGLIRAPSSCIKYSAFTENDLLRTTTTASDDTIPELWHPVTHFLRLKVTLTVAHQTPVSIPPVYSQSPLFMELLGTTWALIPECDGSVLISDTASYLVRAEDLNTRRSAELEYDTTSSDDEEPTIVDEENETGFTYVLFSAAWARLFILCP